MKLTKILLILGVLAALPGCFEEDYSFCPPDYNVSLVYRLPDGHGGCTFLRDISKVTTAIFDGSGALVQTVSTTEQDHNRFQGIRLRLDPGVYRVVSWGNVDANTVLNNIASLYTGGVPTITYNNIVAATVGNGDPVYYAPNSVARSGNAQGEYVMTVDGNGHQGTLDFRNAHRRIEVFVKGFDSNGSTTPILQLGGLPAGLTFLGMGAIPGSGTVTSQVASHMVTVNEGGSNVPYALSPFNVFYLDAADHNIIINVIDPSTGAVVYTTNLLDHIASDDPDKIVLRLVLEFNGIDVTVTIPGWNSGNVDYGIFD